VKVRSKGESSLSIEFVNLAGKPQAQKLDVYFEQGYRGEIDVWIESDGMRWTDNIEIGW
jgi:hypothetical protein